MFNGTMALGPGFIPTVALRLINKTCTYAAIGIKKNVQKLTIHEF